MPSAGMVMVEKMLMPEVSMPAFSMLPSRMSLRKMLPKPTGIHMYVVTRPKVSTLATRRRSSCRRLKMASSGGMISGMNAMWTGMRFWLMIAIARMPATMPHFVMATVVRRALSLVTSSLPMSQFASSVGRPELATAMAKAPSSA